MKKWFPYLRIVLGITGIGIVARFSPEIFTFFEKGTDHELLLIFFEIAIIFVLSCFVFYLSQKTAIPSFVIAIFVGIAAQSFLGAVIERHVILAAIVGFGATLILFGGGLETSFVNFKKMLGKIIALSFPGLFLTALFFSLIVAGMVEWLGVPLSIPAIILLGAVLASTDPASIIPILKSLRFKNQYTKDIIVSESAVTDVTGTLLTIAFLALLAGGVVMNEVLEGYRNIFSAEAGWFLIRQLFFGVLLGVLGYGLLELLLRFKKRHEREFEVDAAFFLFIPIVIFTIALAFGGSGYLAAFIAGLLFKLTEHLEATERFFNHTIDGFFKPTIFLLLGALVDPLSLLSYAGVGILSAIAFMFIIRPIIVFLTLSPWMVAGRERMSWRDVLFISFVRETGAIPAVLIVTIVSMNLPAMEGFLPVGMWVILITLILEPPLTPLVARWLKVAEPIRDEERLPIGVGKPSVVLGTRGHTFLQRLSHVIDWATHHRIHRVVVLLCLEYRYSKELESEISAQAKEFFVKVNEDRVVQGLPPIECAFISRTGFLQENINEISSDPKTNVVAIFVGRKMLDYRLGEIKRLAVPLYFME